MTPAEARQGARILWRLNDWLASTDHGYILPPVVKNVLGRLLVECERVGGSA